MMSEDGDDGALVVVGRNVFDESMETRWGAESRLGAVATGASGGGLRTGEKGHRRYASLLLAEHQSQSSLLTLNID